MRVPAEGLRVGIYARVSTRDKGQDVDTQLVQLREHVQLRGWQLTREYSDTASAGDLGRRSGWRALLEDASRRRVDLVAVWRLDRAFRSTLDALRTLDDLAHRNVGFVSVSQPELDTTSPAGRLVLTVLAAAAELEAALIAERVREGMNAARRKGKRLGRPPASQDPTIAKRWQDIAHAVELGELSKTDAARELGVSRATVRALMRAENGRP